MADLLEEADLDYKDQRKVQIFKLFLPYIASITIAIICFYSIFQWRSNSIQKEKEERTRIILERISGSIKLDNLSDEIINTLILDSDGIADIAKIVKINKLIVANNIEEAKKISDEFISSASNIIFKNFVKNLYISISLDQENLTEENLTKVKTLITSIDKTQPLYYNTKLLHSLFFIKTNDYVKANEVIDEVLNYSKSSIALSNNASAIKNYLNLKGKK